MALKALMLKKKIDVKRGELEAAKTALAEVLKREAEISKAIEEAATDEESAVVEESVEQFEADKAEAESKVSALEGEVKALEGELSEADTEEPEEEEEEREVERPMITREVNHDFVTRAEVKEYLSEVRTCMKEKRAINNVGLTIPEVMLGVLRENIENYSKLYKHVTVRQLSGTGRELIMGAYDEAIWMECCANLNELSLSFYDLELDCFTVGGFYAICNASLEDSDIALASEILTALGQAIGLAIDKAILFGRNTAQNAKMPLGIVSRLAQTAEPSGYPNTARPWVDLHEINIATIPNGTTGANLIAAIAAEGGKAKGKYARGEKVWVMNETTYSALAAATITTTADGRIVSAVNGVMPVVGGVIEVLDFIPDNIIIGGYFDLYMLAERGGQQFASSEHVRFLNNQTVFKGLARYDGAPRIPEAFVVIGINGTTPTAEMTFAADTANTVEAVLISSTAENVAVGGTVKLNAVTTPVVAEITWESSDTSKATVSKTGVVTGVAAGTATITATAGSVSATCTITVAAGA